MRNFTTESFEGAGQYLVRICPSQAEQIKNNRKPHLLDTGFLSTIMYKVGYITNNWAIGGTREQLSCLISMSDGWIRHGYFITKDKDGNKLPTEEYEKILWIKDKKSTGKQKLVDYLNNSKLSQEMRFATQEEVVRVVMYQKSRWK